MTTDIASSTPPTPKAPTIRRVRLGWWHSFWRAALLFGHRLHYLAEPASVADSAPGPLRELVLRLEDWRSQSAMEARTFGADYKGGYWMMYLMAPIAVFCAAGTATGFASPRVLYGVELLLIVWILLLFWTMRRGKWQEHWIAARRTAEHLRYLPLVAPFVRNQTANWYEELAARRGLRIIVDAEVTKVCSALGRTKAVHALRLEDPAFYAGYVNYVHDVLAQQIDYHTDKSAVEKALSKRIGNTGTVFFAITIVCTALLFLGSLAGLTRPSLYLRLCATVLPAIGAGLRGLLAQGESHRVAVLSEGMAKRLMQLRDQLKELANKGSSLNDLENVVWNAVQELLSEADTWLRLQESALLSPAA
jgi:hypothetical protein